MLVMLILSIDVNRSIPDYFITGGIWVQKYALLAMV